MTPGGTVLSDSGGVLVWNSGAASGLAARLTAEGSLEITWSGLEESFVLEGTADLNSPSAWTHLNAPVDRAGANHRVILTPPGQHQFYRLRR